MSLKIVVVGSSNTDMIIKVRKIPAPGETIIGGEFTTAAGGKGANQAVAAARAGGAVFFIARVGDDLFGGEARRGFVADNINVDHVIVDKQAPSGVALIFVDHKGENSIAVASGANANLVPQDILRAREIVESADILLTQLETPMLTVETAARLAHEKGVRVILNPAPAVEELSRSLLQHISILTPNESEVELLTGIRVVDEESAGRAAAALLEKGVETVALTMGTKGVLLKSAGLSRLVPAFRVKAVDTTAAGDVFNGALAVALAEGQSLHAAARFASGAAALSVTKMGAQPSAPTREEIETFLSRS